MVMTQPHADHYGGMGWIFDKLQVNNFYDTRADNSAAKGDELTRKKAKKEPGCQVFYPTEGDSLDWDPNVQVEVLHGCPTAGKSGDYGPEAGNFLNDCSIVLKLTYQGSSVLFTGDFGGEAETQLVQKYGGKLKADVLKVGHHGSAHSTSDAFLKAVKPEKAYIEVGRNNYGHPTPDVLARLKAAGVTIYRTDSGGTLEYSIGGKSPLQVAGPRGMALQQ
jgi:beta-lactamase superfamily II metal-dependent hydrolase